MLRENTLISSPPDGITQADVGSSVWALMDTHPMVVCQTCGAPMMRCEHEQDWEFAPIPRIVSGKLLLLNVDEERTRVQCVVEGHGTAVPQAVFRTEAEARAHVMTHFRKELDLMAKWLVM